MTAYRRDVDETKYMYVLTKDDELLQKYNSIKKEFDSHPVYNENYLTTKIKSFNRKIIKNFRNNKIPRNDSQCICLSVNLINYVFRTGKNNYR